MNEREENIRRRAYEIWEQEGRPHGQDMKHWLQAFKEFADQADGAARRGSTKQGGKAKSAKPGAATKSGVEKQAGKKAKADPIAMTAGSGDKPRRVRTPKSVTTH
ncbi:DUF2934 domain-containing protein [Rhizobium mesoamericanum]|uniref:DUF2934 domain-containing protein n=1 Tax=Rhizobium mesoamericanum STM3625 TaxID=1211777 RepID=K0PXI3_9HYPH|nr:DUF2934 domain-containing protein [Rhizobium mesoamericanum]CCM76062.1 conserved hypothetical protein [Rhizobium mesoamericanum STM3625]